jgi:beta-glucosidase
MKAGYEAQKKSVVLLKNKGQVLPLAQGTKVYIPDCPDTMMYGMAALFAKDLLIPAHPWFEDGQAEKYMRVVKTPEEADVAVVFMDNPKPMIPGYSPKTGYVPITLQYRPYTAQAGREKSIASGDPFSNLAPDRSYRGKTNTSANEKQLDVLLKTKESMGKKPVIAVLDVTGPMVISELEPVADAILMGFELQKQVYLEAITGRFTPSGLLPFQIPADMASVENQMEDVPRDARCYMDQMGHVYDFAYGMDYEGVIQDARVEKYR